MRFNILLSVPRYHLGPMFFLVDNSQAMLEHLEEVENLLALLKNIVKHSVRSSSLEFPPSLFFTQTQDRILLEESTDVADLVLQEPFKGSSNLSGRLAEIFERDIHDFGKPPKISQHGHITTRPWTHFVTTDAKNQHDEVVFMIRDFATRSMAHGFLKGATRLSFIRFGKDTDGIAKLNKSAHDSYLKTRDMSVNPTIVPK